MSATALRRPVSVMVVVISDDGFALLLRRCKPFDFWQSVTGSLRPGETHAQAARRELREETGFCAEGELAYSGISRQFVIDPRWRDKFAPGAIENVEFEWHYRLPGRTRVEICPDEHSEYCWLPVADAARTVWSWTNRAALNGLQA